LATPVLVLVVALPLLRPLRHPGANSVSDDEAARLATIAAVAEHHRLSLEGLDLGPGVPLPGTGLVRSHDHIFSSQPPVLAVILAGPYWVLGKFHLTLRNSPVLAPYLLTLIGVTLPVVGVAGLIYKMSRTFELRREIRCALAAVVVFGGGLISYGVALNAHAPAATLVLASAACLIYLANSQKPRRSIWWAIAAGVCSGLAAVLDPGAAVFTIPFLLVLFTMRWPIVRCSAAAALFAVGVMPPLFLHLALNYPITGDWKPAVLHRELILARTGSRAALAGWGSIGADLAPVDAPAADDEEDQFPVTGWAVLVRPIVRLRDAFFGGHGVFSHFPLVIFGVLGVASVMHRHWPTSTKALATATLIGATAVVIVYALSAADSRGAMFANRWFVVFLPMTIFWIGGWVRSQHRRLTWTAAILCLVFSVAVSLAGAGDPLPREGYDGYTAVQAARRAMPWRSSQPAAPRQPVLSAN
jgi:hypothetical protein